ncbi:hypothetical protein [Luteimonas sp. R10]|uniref:hypothetical protein n=1 Tax=Luteimonas sp. R10 TaxID=3108176 RepID=UPI003087928D|nr:hypothetical protein U3649_01250 [Luteimonas sp. R10]
MTNRILWVALSISLIANVYLFAKFLDAGIMLDNSQSEMKRQRARSELSLAIINKSWIGKSSYSFSVLSKELEGKAGVIAGVEGNAIELGDLVVETKDGVITEVHYID